MKAPRRLLDEPHDALTADLLRSWGDRAPDPRAAERAAVALGVAATAMAPSATLAAAATATTTKAAVSAKVPLLLAAKWCAVGAASATVALGSVQAVRLLYRTGDAPSARVASLAPKPSHPERARSLIVEPSSSEPSRAASAAPNAVPTANAGSPIAPMGARPTGTTHASATAAVAPPAVPSIAWEIAALDQARLALAARDPGGALQSLDFLDRRGTSATFAPEAARLRIEALSLAGRHAEARVLARQFLARYPSGSGAARVRALLEGQTIRHDRPDK